MSAIYGFASQTKIPDPLTLLDKMLKAIPSLVPENDYQWTTQEGNIGLGSIHPARINGVTYFAEDPSSGISCVFDGIIYNDTTGLNGEALVESNGAAFLLEQYLTSGIDCLKKINGNFNVAWWDNKARRLLLANDKLNHNLLFWGFRNNTLVFASLLARVMATGILSSEIDVEGLADLMSYEYILGERTLFKDVHILPPASYLIYEGNKIYIEQYWRLDHIEPYGRYDKRRLHDLIDIFTLAVKRSVRQDLTCAIALTGGLDSRCILATAANQQLSCFTHTGGQPDSTDVILARRLAEQTGVEHSFELTDPQVLGDWLTPMVLHQGGIIATLHSHACRVLYSPPGFDAIVHGIGGEFIRSFWASSRNLHMKSLMMVQKHLKQRMLGNKRAEYLEHIWRPEFRTIGLRSPEIHLNTILSHYSPKGPVVTAMDYLYLHERCRKFLNKGILPVRPGIDVYFPYFDHQWIEAVAAIPISERVTHKIQIDIIKKLYPEILDVPYAKTFIPLSAPLWKTQTIKGYRAIKQRACQKLGLKYCGYAETPVTYYSQWIRKELRNPIADLLYNPNAAFRSYLDWEIVEALLNKHFSGKENWETLISALTVFEISHKLWVKKDSEPLQSKNCIIPKSHVISVA
ncbi:MAG: asparagine synthase [wastewater metagenome]|nr:asparagine synthase [Candidatus Loosdrechtia aerotolerans]